jgi:uncharacterized protein YceH (UPF0502 family)
LLRWVAYASMFIAAYLITMGLAYQAVIRSGAWSTWSAADATKAADEIEQLESRLGGLRQLMRSYQERVATERIPPGPGFTAWAARDFGPELNEIRRRLQQGEWPSDAFQALLSASDRMAAMAGEPGRSGPQEAAAEELARAEEVVEQRVRALRSGVAFLGGR